MKTRIHIISASRFVFELTTEDAPIYDALSRVAETMVAKLTVHATANVVEPSTQTLSDSTDLIRDVTVRFIKGMYIRYQSCWLLVIAGR